MLLAIDGYEREVEQIAEEVGVEVVKAGKKRKCLDGVEAIGLGLDEEVKERSAEINIKDPEPGCMCGFNSTKDFFKSSSKNTTDRPELVKSYGFMSFHKRFDSQNTNNTLLNDQNKMNIKVERYSCYFLSCRISLCIILLANHDEGIPLIKECTPYETRYAQDRIML